MFLPYKSRITSGQPPGLAKFQGLKPFYWSLNVAAEAVTHKDLSETTPNHSQEFKLSNCCSSGLAFHFFPGHPARIGIGRQNVGDGRDLDLRSPREHSFNDLGDA